MTDLELARAGACRCGAALPHGPWSDAQLAEACGDMGMSDPEDFTDCCDDCFVRDVAMGDVAWAQQMACSRPLVLHRTALPVHPIASIFRSIK